MDREGFRKFLKKTGRKEHVIKKLITHVEMFEQYLAENSKIKLDNARKKEIMAYVNSMAQNQVKKKVRGLALYYKFTGMVSPEKALHEIREKEIAGTRKTLKLGEFRDVQPEIIVKLKDIGIVTVEHMLTEGNTPERRRRLAKQTGISQEYILELVKLSDLSRLWAVKSVRARLYYNAGIDTPQKFAEWEPEALRQMLIKYIKRSGFDGIAPLPKELRFTIDMARKLPEAVQYQDFREGVD
jgi:hypothetical protein